MIVYALVCLMLALPLGFWLIDHLPQRWVRGFRGFVLSCVLGVPFSYAVRVWLPPGLQ